VPKVLRSEAPFSLVICEARTGQKAEGWDMNCARVAPWGAVRRSRATLGGRYTIRLFLPKCPLLRLAFKIQLHRFQPFGSAQMSYRRAPFWSLSLRHYMCIRVILFSIHVVSTSPPPLMRPKSLYSSGLGRSFMDWMIPTWVPTMYECYDIRYWPVLERVMSSIPPRWVNTRR